MNIDDRYQGFPSMIMMPRADKANKQDYAFISHETGHQWWGNIVAWRSYGDQWLSEGFAEYSGVLYTGLRDSPKAAENLIDNMRATLRHGPATLKGKGDGNLNDVGQSYWATVCGQHRRRTVTRRSFTTREHWCSECCIFFHRPRKREW